MGVLNKLIKYHKYKKVIEKKKEEKIINNEEEKGKVGE